MSDSAPRVRTSRWVMLAILVVGIALAHYFYGNRHHFFDLKIYRSAVQWWAGGGNLYAYAQPDVVQGVLKFTYPPFGALVLAPVMLLPTNLAVTLFCVADGVILIVTTRWLLAPVARRHGWSLLFSMILALTFISTLEPIRETVTFGQINLVLILLILGDLLVLVPGKSRWAGVGIGLAAAVKLTPAIFIVYLLLSRRRREALTATAAAIIATLAAAAAAPIASWEYWTDTLLHGQGLGVASYTYNQSIYGMLARLALPGTPNMIVWIAVAAPAAGFALWRARRAALAGDEVTGLTLAGLAGGLASPITWAHHLYWVVPALIVLVDAYATRRRGGYLVLVAVVTVSLALGVLSLFEQGLPLDPWSKGLPGFVIRNWDLLVTLVLVVVLPIRPAPRAAPAEPRTSAPEADTTTVR